MKRPADEWLPADFADESAESFLQQAATQFADLARRSRLVDKEAEFTGAACTLLFTMMRWCDSPDDEAMVTRIFREFSRWNRETPAEAKWERQRQLLRLAHTSGCSQGDLARELAGDPRRARDYGLSGSRDPAVVKRFLGRLARKAKKMGWDAGS
jgi:hypothetical protein